MKANLFFAHMETLGLNVGAQRAVGVYTPSHVIGPVRHPNYYGLRLQFGRTLQIGVLTRSRRALSARAAVELVAAALIPSMPTIARLAQKATS